MASEFFVEYEGETYYPETIAKITGYHKTSGREKLKLVIAGKLEMSDLLEMRKPVLIEYTDKSGETYSAKRLAKSLGISSTAARYRLKDVISGKLDEKWLHTRRSPYENRKIDTDFRPVGEKLNEKQEAEMKKMKAVEAGEISINQFLGYK